MSGNGIPEAVSGIQLSGTSQKIDQIRQLVGQVSNTDVNVLITGESGTGKEIVARMIHSQSNRKEKPFVAVNCGAIPNDLLESEIFGHEKGAFTGAITSRMGRFELADGGTLFLDEIGDMPLSMQVKLLRVIQEKMFERVGSNKSVKVNVRIIAATHRQLENEIKQGRFREDLYYRLSVFPIEVPSLRQRIEDLEPLILDLISRFQGSYGAQIQLSSSVLTVLKKFPWLGNIRELSNLIERLIVLYPNQIIDLDKLPEKYHAQPTLSIVQPESRRLSIYEEMIADATKLSADGVNLKEILNQIEIAYIKEALEKENGVVAHAAQILGMRRTTLVEKMKKYDMDKFAI